MTENEAILSMKNLDNVLSITEREHESVRVAIQALEEIQAYRAIGTVEEITNLINFLRFDDDTSILEDLRMLVDYYAIGTVEECRTAVERMKPKKAVGLKNNICPTCSWIVDGANKHCEKCGQAVDF